MRTLVVSLLVLAALSAKAAPAEPSQTATPAKPVNAPAELTPEQKAAMDQVLDSLLRSQARRATAEKAHAVFTQENPQPISEFKIAMEEPTPVTGKAHSYRTAGKASFKRADSKDGSPVLHTRTFESITEIDANGQTHVTEFSAK